MKQALAREAVRIADRIVESAIWHGDECTWFTYRRDVGPQGGAMGEALDTSIHTGTAGMSLFLGRVYQATGDSRYRRAALGAARHALHYRCFVDPEIPGRREAPTGTKWRLGYQLGVMGIIYAAAETAVITNDDPLKRKAKTAFDAEAKSRRFEAADDLMMGKAGGMLVALALAQRGYGNALPLAEKLAGRLLRTAFVRGDTMSWGEEQHDPHRRNLTGFSHGACGIGFGFSQLFKNTGKDVYHEAAVKAFRYGETLWRESPTREWPEFSKPPGQAPMVSWCNGPPGMGLARALSLDDVRNDASIPLLKAARDATAQRLERHSREPGEVYHLCCGTAGLIECLDGMNKALGISDTTLLRAAELGVERYGLLHSRETRGWCDWPTGAPRGSHPGLIQGIAGIGVMLLRLSDPSIPSVLFPEIH